MSCRHGNSDFAGAVCDLCNEVDEAYKSGYASAAVDAAKFLERAESAERDYHTLEEKFDSLTKDFVDAMTEKGEAERKLAEAVAALKDARPFVAEKDDGYGVTNNHTLRVLARIDEATK